MPEFFSILAAIFAIIASVFGVKNRRNNSSKLRAGSSLRDDWPGYNDTISSDSEIRQLEQNVGERLLERDEWLERVNGISNRIKLKEPETGEEK